MMATRKSDDPMDLGGFMQNFVLSNPFKDLPDITTDANMISQSDSDDQRHKENGKSQGNSDISTVNTDGSSAGSGSADSVAEKEYVVADENGQVVDTPKAHVGSNIVFAASLKLQKVSGAHAKVQKWLRNNYLYEPSYSGTKCSKEVAAEVQKHFPHISSMTLSKIMTFTFPDCIKVTNISGFNGYKGLVAKPQPEDYCHLELLKAVSHCKLYGCISEAAQLYGVSSDSVASLYYWHPDLSSLPVHMSVAEELQKQIDQVDFLRQVDTSDEAQEKTMRHYKRSRRPAACHETDGLSEGEDVLTSKDKNAARLTHNTTSDLKEETGSVDGGGTPCIFSELSPDNQATYSLLRNLLKHPKKEGSDIQRAEAATQGAQPLDLHTVYTVKSEPVDAGYGDCDLGRISPTADYQQQSASTTRRKQKEKDTCVQSKNDDHNDNETMETKLRSEIQRLKGRINTQLAKNQKQEVQLLLAQKDILSLKSALCAHQVTFTELSQDFANLQDQFCTLNRKFKRALEQLENDKEETTPVKKKKCRSSVNGQTS